MGDLLVVNPKVRRNPDLLVVNPRKKRKRKSRRTGALAGLGSRGLCWPFTVTLIGLGAVLAVGAMAAIGKAIFRI